MENGASLLKKLGIIFLCIGTVFHSPIFVVVFNYLWQRSGSFFVSGK